MEAIAGNNPFEYGIVSAVLLVMWKLLDVAKTMFLAKRVEPAFVAGAEAVHFQQVQDIHHHVEQVDRQIAAGDFACKWRDRDEVRDYMEILRVQTNASKAQTTAITALTAELRLTRNGGH